MGYEDFYLGLTRELADLYRAGESPEQEAVSTVAVSPTETAALSPIATPTVPPTVLAEASTLDSGGAVRGEMVICPMLDMATPTPMQTERAAAWAGGGWVMGALVALLAVGAVAQALRLRREVIGG